MVLAQVPGGRQRDLAARLGAAGEGHLVDPWVGDERGAGLTAAGDQVHDAGRKPNLLEHRHQLEERRRGVFAGLQDDGVPAGEGGRELHRRELQRRVPGDDRRDDADRLPERVVEQLRPVARDDVPEDLVRDPAVVVEELRDALDLAGRLAQQLAVVERLEPRELVDVSADQVREPAQHRAAGRLGQIAPLRRGQRPPRRRDRPVDLLGRRVGRRVPGLGGRRIEAVEGGARGLDPGAVDPVAVGAALARSRLGPGADRGCAALAHP